MSVPASYRVFSERCWNTFMNDDAAETGFTYVARLCDLLDGYSDLYLSLHEFDQIQSDAPSLVERDKQELSAHLADHTLESNLHLATSFYLFEAAHELKA